MVKAAAYGSGIGEVAKFLEYQNVDYLAVAYTDEGIEVRNRGVKLPILVLNPDITAFESLLSTIERRMLMNNEGKSNARISDMQGVLPAINGKVELVYEGEQEGGDEVN